MGYRKKYHNLKILKYSETPSGRKLKNKYIIADGNIVVAGLAGLTISEAKKLLPIYQKQKHFVFCG